jgi:hypothetical protein
VEVVIMPLRAWLWLLALGAFLLGLKFVVKG